MPQQQAHRHEYETGWSVSEIFLMSNVGITTARDSLTIHITEAEIREVVQQFKPMPVETAREKYHLGPDARDWKVDLAQADLRTSQGVYAAVLYRPYDIRYTYYTGVSRGFHCMPRWDLMRQMLATKNLGLGIAKGIETGNSFDHVFVSSTLFTHHSVSSKEVNYLFPLWRYPTENEAMLGVEREANIAPAFTAEVKERIEETATPEAIFYYAYAILHAPTYRTRYAAFLKTGFPRLPLPPDAETFHSLARLGAKLTALHLLEDPALQQHGIGFPIPGDHTVKKMRTTERYIPPTPSGNAGRVKLNDAEYFDNVPPEAWEFRVGGYQPAAKWLEDRAGRALTADDITHYRRMIAAMRETAALLPQVDTAFLELLEKNTEPAAEGQEAE